MKGRSGINRARGTASNLNATLKVVSKLSAKGASPTALDLREVRKILTPSGFNAVLEEIDTKFKSATGYRYTVKEDKFGHKEFTITKKYLRSSAIPWSPAKYGWVGTSINGIYEHNFPRYINDDGKTIDVITDKARRGYMKYYTYVAAEQS